MDERWSPPLPDQLLMSKIFPFQQQNPTPKSETPIVVATHLSDEQIFQMLAHFFG
jgi:hypothetical protein